MSAPGSSAVSTQVILTALAQEVDHAGALCDRLEILVSRLIGGADGEPLQIALHEAQTIDALQQHLTALSSFMRGLKRQGERDGGFDIAAALDRIPLADLAKRLSDQVQDLDAHERSADAGDLLLF
jgi:hypothetical protein